MMKLSELSLSVSNYSGKLLNSSAEEKERKECA